jgi:hypothetical protein
LFGDLGSKKPSAIEVINPPREYPANHCPKAPATAATISKMIKLSKVMFMI